MTSEGGDDVVTYAYRPSVLGAAMEFQLAADALEWRTGNKSGRVMLRDVRLVRMSYKPATMQSHRFVTEIWADRTPHLDVVSTSWKSMVEQERLDAQYTSFVFELHRRIARAGARVRFVKGKPAFLFWPGLVLFVAMSLALAALIPRALQGHTLGGAAVIAVFLALFLWQGGNFFRRNKPGIYRADALPPELMPKA
jgi:hypothetical protein